VSSAIDGIGARFLLQRRTKKQVAWIFLEETELIDPWQRGPLQKKQLKECFMKVLSVQEVGLVSGNGRVGQVVGGIAGAIAGDAGGAAAGAVIGAAVGSVVPGIGTVVGGMIGEYVGMEWGGLAGGAIGTQVGDYAGDEMDDN
jgi:hypothetical protein